MPIHAKAAVADGKGSFTIESIEVHPPQRDEVLVAIKASGVCHTDHDSLNWGGHFVLGHEGAQVDQAHRHAQPRVMCDPCRVLQLQRVQELQGPGPGRPEAGRDQ